MGRRHVIVDHPDCGYRYEIDEPRSWRLAAMGARATGRGLWWLLPRLLLAVGVAWSVATAVAMGLVVFVAIPLGMFVLRLLAGVSRDVIG